MVVLVTVLDVCLTSSQIRELLVDLFVQSLQRDDVRELTDSFYMQIQTNIESWRSVGCVRGMVSPLTAVKENRFQLIGESAVPQLNRAELREVFDFLIWLLAGEKEIYRIISATIYSMVEAIRSAGIQTYVSESEERLEGQLMIQYARNSRTIKELIDVLESDLSYLKISTARKTVAPPQRISYQVGRPSQMIETFPRSVAIKNQMAFFWTQGAQAGGKVKFQVYCATTLPRIRYRLVEYDACSSRCDGTVSTMTHRHFPVESESLMQALDNLLVGVTTSNQT